MSACEKRMMGIDGYLPCAECMGCEKADMQCVILVTEGFSGPHCGKCVMREAKKRAAPKVEVARLDNGQSAPIIP